MDAYRLLSAAPDLDWPRVFATVGPQLPQVLSSLRESTSIPLVEALAGITDEEALCQALDHRHFHNNPHAAGVIRGAALRVGSRRLRAAVVRNSDVAQLRAGFRAAGTDVSPSLARCRTPELLVGAVVSPAPKLVRRALAVCGTTLTAQEQLLALTMVAEHDGGVAAWTSVPTELLRPTVAELVATVTDSGDRAPFDAALRAADGTAGLIEELCDGTPGDRIGDYLALREPVDWDTVTAAAIERTFTEEAVVALVTHDDCPLPLRAALLTRYPKPVLEHNRVGDAALLTAPCAEADRPLVVSGLVQRFLGDPITVDEVLDLATPAWAALHGLQPELVRRTGPRERLPVRLGGMITETLGADPAAWRAAWELLADFPGTVGELLSAAASRAEEFRDVPFPAALPLDDGMIEAVEGAFVTLVNAAPPEVHRVLVPLLPVEHTLVLFRTGRWCREWIDLAVDADRLDLVDAVIDRGTLDAAAVERLAEYNDVNVIVTLLAQDATPEKLRRYWLSDPTPELVAAMQRWALRLEDRYWLTDEKLIDTWNWYSHYMMPNVAGFVPRLRTAAELWRRHDAALIRWLLPAFSRHKDSPDVVEILTELLARPDEAAALAELEQRVRDGSTPQAQVALWRTRRDFARLADEDHVWHWDAIVEAHAREPFAVAAVERMATVDGCPESLRRQAAVALPTGSHRAYSALTKGTDPVTVLRDNPVDRKDRDGCSWIMTAEQAGMLDHDQILRYAHPAHAVIDEMTLGDPDHWPAVVARADRHLADHTEAWLLVLRMLPDFAGSVDELLSTAALAAGV